MSGVDPQRSAAPAKAATAHCHAVPHLRERRWRFGGLRGSLPSEEAAATALPGLHAAQQRTRQTDADDCSGRCATILNGTRAPQTRLCVQLIGLVRIDGARARRVCDSCAIDASGCAGADTPFKSAPRRNGPPPRAACDHS